MPQHAHPFEFWFEFASTYSYPAAMRIERVAEAAGFAIQWRPFLLGPIFQQQGLETTPFNAFPVKGRYMFRDLERICEKEGLPFKRPSIFPQNGVRAARIACTFADAPWIGNFIRAVYTANFAHDQNISDMHVLQLILIDLGLNPEEIINSTQTPEHKNKLRENTDEALHIGIFGAPTIRIGDELFWGNDRIEDAFAWFKRHSL